MVNARRPASIGQRAAPVKSRLRSGRTVRSAEPTAAIQPGLTLSERAYGELEELIVTLQLAPGTAVSEAALSQRLGIGRTPIREALQRLAREQLVVAMPQRGYLVTQIDVRLQLRLLETRREVERLIARSAARRATLEEQHRFATLADEFQRASDRNDDTAFIRADRDFNNLCLQAARNEFAAGAMQLMNGLSRRFWYMHWKQAADMPVAARSHAHLARMISLRDEDGAAHALNALLDGILEFTKATLNSDV